jgi:hypothetical protein
VTQTVPGLASLLPLKLSGRHYGDNLGRLDLLLSSLVHFGEPGLLDPFLVVTPADEVPAVRRHVEQWPELDITVVVEEDHFPAFRRYRKPWQVRPWQRQQVIKLAAPDLTSAPFVLTLDPDVLAVHKVSRDLLLPHGRALLVPEPRSAHPAWWRASADVLDVPADPGGPGMGVTPALLSADILRSVHRRIEAVSGRPWVDTLLTTYADWTEYSLYLLEATRSGLLDDQHQWCGTDTAARLQVAPERSIWTRREATPAAVARLYDDQDPGLFAVVQSNAGMPVAEIAAAVAEVVPLRLAPEPPAATTSAPPDLPSRLRNRVRFEERFRTASRLVASRLYAVRREVRRGLSRRRVP